jgi:poly-gamma-glutamate synthesis protein (capsule biosynthesis protein)
VSGNNSYSSYYQHAHNRESQLDHLDNPEDITEEELYTPPRKKSYRYIFASLIVATLLGSAYFLSESIETEVLGSSDINYYSNEYYILQTDLRSSLETVDLESLGEYDLYISDSVESKESIEIQRLIGIEEASGLKAGTNPVGGDQNSWIVITPISEKNIKYKYLPIDGFDIINDEAIREEYPLRFKTLMGQEEWDTLADYHSTANQEYNVLFVGGEIITARAVDRLWINSTDNAGFLFDRVEDKVSSADIALSMLENSYEGNPEPCTGCVSFLSDEKVLHEFKDLGFDVFSLAGNHAGDKGQGAASNTRNILDSLDIKHFGTGENIAEASGHTVIESKGVRFAFLGADDVAYFYWAGEERAGTNYYTKSNSLSRLEVDYEKIRKDIESAKKDADVAVVMMSWGIEYQNFATKYQREMAKAFVDSGADLVVGSHPHWVQNIEFIESPQGKSVPVVYSLGNFIFDQTHTQETREGMLAEFTFEGKNLIDMKFTPILNCGYHQTQNNLADKVISGEMTYAEIDKISEREGCVWWQPKPLDSSHSRYRAIYDRMWEYSGWGN